MTVRYARLPRSIHGFVSHATESDGEYDTIVLNALDPPSVQKKTYDHEVNHVEYGHFDDDRPLYIREREAEYGK